MSDCDEIKELIKNGEYRKALDLIKYRLDEYPDQDDKYLLYYYKARAIKGLLCQEKVYATDDMNDEQLGLFKDAKYYINEAIDNDPDSANFDLRSDFFLMEGDVYNERQDLFVR